MKCSFVIDLDGGADFGVLGSGFLVLSNLAPNNQSKELAFDGEAIVY